MNSIKRILLCGAIFAIGLPFGFFVSEAVYDSDLLIHPGIVVGDMATMWLGAAGVFWFFGCIVSIAVIAIEKRTAHMRKPWLVLPMSGVLIPLIPLCFLMIWNQALFFAQDNLILAIAGLCTGITLALTREREGSPDAKA